MKLIKTLAAGTIAVAAISSAFADVTLKITGSTAFRRAEYAGIVNWLTTNVGPVTGAFVTDSGAALNSSNQAIFVAGTTPNKVVIQCGQGGSTGGLRFTVQGPGVFASIKPDGSATDKVWISESNARSAITVNGSGQATGGTTYTTAAATFDAPSRANITMADTYQDSTQWNSNDFDALAEIPGGALGVQGYVMAKGQRYSNVPQASYDRLVNVQGIAFQYLAANGVAKLSLFTGNSADTGIDVVLIGRDYDSGTRTTAFYETGYGSDLTPAVQYRVKDALNVDVGDGTGAGNVDHFELATDPNGDGYAGYNSGGFVRNVLNKVGGVVLSPNGNPAIVLGYMGTGDVPAVPAQVLSFGGVAQSATTISYGNYTFWAPEHMYYISLAGANFATAGTQKFVANGIATEIRKPATIAASGAIAISAMNSSRSGEGQVISPN